MGGRAVSYLSVRRGRPPAFYESGHGTTKRYADHEAMRHLIGRLLSPLTEWVRKRFSEKLEIEGFHVVLENWRRDIDSEDVLARFRESLALLEQVQPWRVAHMRRDVLHFWIVRQPVRGMYLPSQRVVMTELTFLARRDISPAVVAASILHEATHARIHGMRLRPESWNRDREERICRRAELEFGRALPSSDGRPVIERAELSLAQPSGALDFEIDWTRANREMATIDRQLSRGRKGAA